MFKQKVSILGLTVLAVVSTACTQSEPVQSVEVQPLSSEDNSAQAVEESQSSDSTIDFVAPPIPAWVNERTFPDVGATAETQSDLFNRALDLHKDGDFDAAYPIFSAVADNGLKVAHVYLGLIESQPGSLFYPRGALTHQYEALDSGAHATSLAVLARELASGVNIAPDPAGSLQYYARLIPTLPADNALVTEAKTSIRMAEPKYRSKAIARERAALKAAGETLTGNDLAPLVAAVADVTASNKAPGTEYLADYPR